MKRSWNLATIRLGRPLRALACASLLFGFVGCYALGPSGPTKVSRGELYVSGVPEYDAYFEELHALGDVLGRAPVGEKEVRSELAENIDLEKTASLDLIAERLKKRSEQLSEHGVSLKVEFLGLEEGKAEGDASISTNGELHGQDASFVRHVERGAKRAAKLVLEMKKAKQKAHELVSRLPDLEARVDVAYHLRGPARATEAKRNLYDAKVMLPLMIERSDAVTQAELDLIKAIQEAVKSPDTDAYKDTQMAGAEASPPAPAKTKPAAAPARPRDAKPVKPVSAPAKPDGRKTTFADFSP